VRSHERFRVVSEDEFFQGVGLDWTGAAARAPRAGRRRRMTSLAMLIGAVGATAGVSAASLSSRAAHSLRQGTIAAPPRAQPSAGARRARDLVASVASRVAFRRDGRGKGRRSWRRRASAVRATVAVRATGAVHATGAVRPPRLRPMRSGAQVVIGAVGPAVAEHVVVRRELDATTSAGAASRPRTRESEFGFER